MPGAVRGTFRPGCCTGQINFEFWQMLEKLENMFGPASAPGAALLDG